MRSNIQARGTRKPAQGHLQTRIKTNPSSNSIKRINQKF